MGRIAFAAELRAASSAVQFLTRIPPPFPSGEETWRADLARAPRYFPWIGGLVGLTTGLLFWLLCHVLPPPIAAALALGAEALVTGAFHEDALADFCDAFGGGTTPERVREILKDSRIGSYGALGLGIGLLVRWSALTALDPVIAIAASAAAGAIGRAAAVAAMALLAPDPARASLAKDIGSKPGGASVSIAMVGMLVACTGAFWVQPVHTAAAIAVALLPLAYILAAMKRVVGGVTGDGLGAIAFLAQALALVVFAVTL